MLMLSYFACNTLRAQNVLIPVLIANEKKVIIDNQVKTAYFYKINSKRDTVVMHKVSYDLNGNTVDSTRLRNGNLEMHYSLKSVGDTLFRDVNLYGESAWAHNSEKYKNIIKEKNMMPPPKDTFSFTEVRIGIDSIMGFQYYIYYCDSLIFKERFSRYKYASEIGFQFAAVRVKYDGSYSILDNYNMIPDTIDSKAVHYTHRFNNDSLVVVEDKIKYLRFGQNYIMFIYNERGSGNLLNEYLHFYDRTGTSNHFFLSERILFDYKYDEIEEKQKLHRIEAERSEEILEFDEKERVVYYNDPYVRHMSSLHNYEYKVQYGDNNSLFKKVSVYKDGELSYIFNFQYEYH